MRKAARATHIHKTTREEVDAEKTSEMAEPREEVHYHSHVTAWPSAP